MLGYYSANMSTTWFCSISTRIITEETLIKIHSAFILFWKLFFQPGNCVTLGRSPFYSQVIKRTGIACYLHVTLSPTKGMTRHRWSVVRHRLGLVMSKFEHESGNLLSDSWIKHVLWILPWSSSPLSKIFWNTEQLNSCIQRFKVHLQKSRAHLRSILKIYPKAEHR